LCKARVLSVFSAGTIFAVFLQDSVPEDDKWQNKANWLGRGQMTEEGEVET